MSGLLSFFNPDASQQQQQQQLQQPAPQGQHAPAIPAIPSGTPSSVQVHSQQQQQQAPAALVSQATPNADLDPFAAIFAPQQQSVDPATGQPIAQANPETPAQLFANDDPEKLKKIVEGLQFAPVVTPELQAKLQAGDPEAITSLVNHATRQAYLQLTTMMKKVTEHGVNFSQDQIQKKLPSMYKELVGQQAFADDPLLSHKAVAPVVQEVYKNFATKYPNATPAQLQQATRDYFNTFSSQLQQQQQKEKPATASNPFFQPAETQSWDSMFSGNV